MRFLVLILISLIMIGSISAKSYLIVNKDTKEVLSLSPENDAQLPNADYEKIILDEDYWDIELTESAVLYKYKNGRFIKNLSKISDIENEREKGLAEIEEEKLVRKRMKKIARDQLIEEGLIK